MTTEFFMPMHPPTVTHHDKRITVKNGKPIMYDSTELKATKSKLTSHLAEYAPGAAIQRRGQTDCQMVL